MFSLKYTELYALEHEKQTNTEKTADGMNRYGAITIKITHNIHRVERRRRRRKTKLEMNEIVFFLVALSKERSFMNEWVAIGQWNFRMQYRTMFILAVLIKRKKRGENERIGIFQLLCEVSTLKKSRFLLVIARFFPTSWKLAVSAQESHCALKSCIAGKTLERRQRKIKTPKTAIHNNNQLHNHQHKTLNGQKNVNSINFE